MSFYTIGMQVLLRKLPTAMAILSNKQIRVEKLSVACVHGHVTETNDFKSIWRRDCKQMAIFFLGGLIPVLDIGVV